MLQDQELINIWNENLDVGSEKNNSKEDIPIFLHSDIPLISQTIIDIKKSARQLWKLSI
jgi:hypothetical protein